MHSTFKTIILFTLLTFILTSCKNKKQDYFYHVLMIEFSKDADIEQITKEILKFEDIPTVKEVRYGNIKPHNRNIIQNFSHCLILIFDNEKGLQEYLKDPYHEKIYEKHKPYIADIYTADFNSISLIE
ncbi:MAG: Dabb family protein [Flavobacteriaceae bacterium]|nr:Dabb family protein [Flavobacteriaceae bacterium]